MRFQPEFAVAVASAYNDLLIEKWLDRDSRLKGSVHIAPQDPEAAVREIHRVGEHPSMVQVMMPLSFMLYGEKRFLPIFEAADRYGLEIGMHQASEIGMGLQYQYYIEWHAALSLSFQNQLLGLIFHGIPDRFPDLKFVMTEGGFTWLPSLMWRLDQHYRSLRLEVPWVKRMPSDIIRSQFRFGTQPIEDISAEQLLQLIDWMGSDELLVFSTDYPHWDTDEPTRALPRGLPKDLLQKIMLDNARATYRRL